MLKVTHHATATPHSRGHRYCYCHRGPALQTSSLPHRPQPITPSGRDPGFRWEASPPVPSWFPLHCADRKPSMPLSCREPINPPIAGVLIPFTTKRWRTRTGPVFFFFFFFIAPDSPRGKNPCPRHYAPPFSSSAIAVLRTTPGVVGIVHRGRHLSPRVPWSDQNNP